MIEDNDYRTSSQYRYWSFTHQKLAETRNNTNAIAAEKVKAAFRRARTVATSPGSHNGDHEDIEADIQTLTVDEELKIVQWGCSKIIEMGTAIVPPIPPNIVVCCSPLFGRYGLTSHLGNSSAVSSPILSY